MNRATPWAEPDEMAGVRMNRAELVLALDEWMRKFIERPKEFDEKMQRITQTLREEGQDPSYGLAGVAFLEMCLHDAKQRMT
jgi:hypothetical protein